MYDPNAELVTLEDILAAKKLADSSNECRRTPLLKNMQSFFGIPIGISMHMKLENFQNTGSYKIRGVVNQLQSLPQGSGKEESKLVTLSAGNYGKAFSYMLSKLSLKGLVLMPPTAPDNREEVIRSYGVEVERVPSSELQITADKYCAEKNTVYCHSFDDHRLIAGHAGAGLEILEDVPDPDVVLVCCGGGALLSGIAASIKLSGHSDCRVYGVEPEGANTMYRSLKEGKPMSMNIKTIAAGLAPPYAGPNAFKHVKEYVEDILVVTDEEIVKAMFVLFKGGLVVESSGSAAFSALYHGKVPDVEGKNVVVVITGGNVTPDELVALQVNK